MLQWADQWSDEDPYEDLPGRMWFFCFPSPDGPLTTPHSEGTREGVDDLRYVRTLERLVSHCGRSDDRQWKHQSEEAEKYIRSVLEKVSVDREWRTAADGADLETKCVAKSVSDQAGARCCNNAGTQCDSYCGQPEVAAST